MVTERLLRAGPADLASHRRTYGPLPRVGGDAVIEWAGQAGLTGRGGAGFPAGRKLAAVAAAGSRRGARRPVVVGNAAEGEPASAKDRVLMTVSPHLVLDGLQLAAHAVDAGQAYLYVNSGTAAPARAALAERTDPVLVTVVDAPDRFVAGQESAVVARIEGRPAVPRDTVRRVVESGVRGAPTLVQNVETLAHLALLVRHGPAWFRQAGTPDEPGTFLATVSGAVRTPGVYEAPYGIPLGQLFELAGGLTYQVQAALVGGYHGAWVPPDQTLPVSRAGLRPYQAAPGAGVVVALPYGVCGLAESARVTSYLAGQSADQCGPCRNGLPRMADTLTRLAWLQRQPPPRRWEPGQVASRPRAGRAAPADSRRLAAEVARLASLVTGRGACAHPDGTARFVTSTLRTFDTEVRAHLAGHCTARSR
jgi:NADH:ubiquinone oxidoreductase subunit F (NADH-binding)